MNPDITPNLAGCTKDLTYAQLKRVYIEYVSIQKGMDPALHESGDSIPIFLTLRFRKG